jgi:glycerate dehydrogenase
MKIKVLDGYALNPGDLNWDGVKKFGELEVFDRTPSDKAAERAKGAEVILLNKTPIGENEFKQLPELKFISVLATGYNIVDTEAAKRRGILVANIPTYGTNSVSQMVFALLLELCHHVSDHSNSVRKGDWASAKDWCYWNYPLIELADKTMGIIGFGRIGKQTARIANAFGMKVLVYDKIKTDASDIRYEWKELDDIFSVSDVISLHCPLFPETKGIINIAALKKMKNSAFLINTSRGPLVVEEDLAKALNDGIIAGAGIDVLNSEPPKQDNPLFKAKNVFLTPHISWATKEARSRLMNQTEDNIRAYVEGNPINIVNK